MNALGGQESVAVVESSGSSSARRTFRTWLRRGPALDVPAFVLSIAPSVRFRDCQFHGGQLLSSYPSLSLTNCLLERVYADLEPSDGQVSYLRNCLAYGGVLAFGPTNSASLVVYDSLFDQPALLTNWNGYTGGHNAYLTNSARLQPTQSNDLILSASPSYRAGPLERGQTITFPIDRR